jgi:hypothetical protein
MPNGMRLPYEIGSCKMLYDNSYINYERWSFMGLESFNKLLGYLYLIIGFLLIIIGLFVIVITRNLFIGDLSVVLGIIFVTLGIISLNECS